MIKKTNFSTPTFFQRLPIELISGLVYWLKIALLGICMNGLIMACETVEHDHEESSTANTQNTVSESMGKMEGGHGADHTKPTAAENADELQDNCGVRSYPSIGGAFTMQTGNGEPFRSETVAGKIVWLYFGYTNCPDVCPQTLATVTAAYKKSGYSGDDVVMVFITVDPENDTPETLRNYLNQFHPEIIGLFASADQTKQTADTFYVSYGKTHSGDSHDGMTHEIMIHNDRVFLLDRRGTVRFMEQVNTDATKLLTATDKLIACSEP